MPENIKFSILNTPLTALNDTFPARDGEYSIYSALKPLTMAIKFSFEELSFLMT